MAGLTLFSGRLRHRIDIQQRVEVQDPNSGEITYTWVSILTKPIAAEVSPASAKEFIASEAMQSQIIAKIVIRYRPGIVAKMRAVQVVKGITTYYNIAGVLNDPQSGLEWITMPCSAGLNDG